MIRYLLTSILLLAFCPIQSFSQQVLHTKLKDQHQFILFGEKLKVSFSGKKSLVIGGSNRPLLGVARLVLDTLQYEPRPDTLYSDTLYIIDQTRTSEIIITCFPYVGSDVAAFSEPIAMDRTKEDYTQIDSLNTIRVVRNGNLRDLHDVVVSGITLKLAKGNPVFDALNRSQSLREVEFYAQEIILEDSFWLYQANLHLYAQKITFVDKAGQTACFITSPLLAPVPKERDPVNGYIAGDIHLFCDTFYLPSTSKDKYRFIMQGSKGSDAIAGAGRGDSGMEPKPLSSTNTFNYYKSWNGCYREPVKHTFLYKQEFNKENQPNSDQVSKGAREIWSAFNGKPAKRGTEPGNGGSGGNFYSNHIGIKGRDLPLGWSGAVLDNFVYQTGGTSGKGAKAYQGGLPDVRKVYICYRYSYYEFNPNGGGRENGPSRILQNNCNCPSYVELENGSDESATSGQDGASGKIYYKRNKKRYTSTLVLMHELQYAKDLYRHNYFQAAYDQLSAIIDAIKGLEKSEPKALTNQSLVVLYQECMQYRQQLERNLDFYGNPLGWVPMVPYAHIEGQYEKEVGHAGALLAAIHRLYDAIERREATAAQADQMRADLAHVIEDNLNGIAGIQQSLVDLRGKAERVEDLVTYVNQRIRDREAELEAVAGDMLEKQKRKKRLGQICAVAQMIPYGQPYLGVVAKGVQMYNDDRLGSVSEIISAGQELYGTYNDLKDYQANVEQLLTDAQKIRYGSLDEFRSTLKSNGPALKQSYEKIYQHIKANSPAFKTSVPLGQAQALLENLKENDPAYRELIGDVDSLLRQKAGLITALDAATAQIDKYISEIQLYHLCLDSMASIQITQSDLRNPMLLTYLQMIEDQTWERVYKYFYYLYKAYEYAYLTRYTGEVDFFKLKKELIQSKKAEDITPFLQKNLSKLSEDILTQAVNNAGCRDCIKIEPYRLKRTEIDQLNRTGSVVIDLCKANFFRPDRENIRLVRLEVIDPKYHLDYNTSDISSGNIELKLFHKGHSMIERNGRRFAFQHYSWQTQNEMYWESGISLVTNTPTTAQTELNDFFYLFFKERTNINYSNLNPAGCAELILTKSCFAEGIDLSNRLTIDTLQLKVIYYSETNNTKNRLVVHANETQPCFFKVAQKGQADNYTGYNDLIRSFPDESSIRITAISVNPEAKFVKWVQTDTKGQEVSVYPEKSPIIEIKLSNSLFIKAVFE